MLISAILSAVYVILILPAIRGGWRRGAAAWLVLYLTTSVVLAALPAAETAGLFAGLRPEISPGRVFAALLLAGLGLLGAVTFKYLELRRAWVWPAANLVLTAGVIALDATLPVSGLRETAWLRALARSEPPPAAVLGAALWLANWIILLGLSLRAQRRARLPLHANRSLVWSLVLSLALAGEAAWLLGGPIVMTVGRAIRLAGVACAVYAATSDWLVDVRGLFRSGLGNAVVVLFTAAVALLGIGLAQLLSGLVTGEARLAAVLAVALLLALGYQLLRGRIEQLVNQTVLRAGYDPGQVSPEKIEAAIRKLL